MYEEVVLSEMSINYSVNRIYERGCSCPRLELIDSTRQGVRVGETEGSWS